MYMLCCFNVDFLYAIWKTAVVLEYNHRELQRHELVVFCFALSFPFSYLPNRRRFVEGQQNK